MNKIKQVITFSNADIGYSKTIIEKFSGSLGVGDKVGILGPNGSGKTCLLKTIYGNTELLSGSLNTYGSLFLISQVLQIPEVMKNITIEQFLSQKGLSLAQINAFSKKKFQQSFKNISLKDISGGEFTILQIAVSFLMSPDILLLDEPTNHLDFSARKILLKLLKDFNGSIIFISHDIWFLDNLANKLWIIENNLVRNFQGTYSDYKKEEQLKMRALKRKSLRVSLITLSKKKNIYSLDSSSLYINDSCLIQGIKLDQSLGDRYVIFGKNGSGKSSFAKALIGVESYRFEPEAKINKSAKIVYFDQQYSAINPEQTVLENMQVYSNMFTDDIRKHLSRYLFFTQQDVNQKARHLSGGMLARLACAIITISPIDLLILDEPTNNLDIETIQELISALSEYKGALLVISHDINFVRKLEPNKLLFIRNNIFRHLSVNDLSEIEDISNLL